MSGPVKIAIIDDHRIFLDGISLLVDGMEDAFDVVGFDVPADILNAVSSGAKFDLVICDLIMDAMNGLAFVAAFRTFSKTTPVLMLSGINTASPLEELKRLGGNGFVHKSASHDVLKEAIKTTLAGGYYFTSDIEGLHTEYKTLSPSFGEDESFDDKTIPQLATRQIEVLKLIANGATNKEISQSLSISENTVKSHLKQIFLALGVNKRTACVRKAQMLGLI